jgi:hypothetical protein
MVWRNQSLKAAALPGVDDRPARAECADGSIDSWSRYAWRPQSCRSTRRVTCVARRRYGRRQSRIGRPESSLDPSWRSPVRASQRSTSLEVSRAPTVPQGAAVITLFSSSLHSFAVIGCCSPWTCQKNACPRSRSRKGCSPRGTEIESVKISPTCGSAGMGSGTAVSAPPRRDARAVGAYSKFTRISSLPGSTYTIRDASSSLGMRPCGVS